MAVTARNTTYEFYQIGTLDPTRKNVWGFQNSSEREAFLQNHLKMTSQGNYFWRPGKPIRVNFSTTSEFSFERSFKFDYVRITNRSTDGNQRMVYYCFVIEHTYINTNLTELTLDIDWTQTFYFNQDGMPWWNVRGYVAITNSGYPIENPPRGTVFEIPALSKRCLWKWRRSAKNNFAYLIYSSVDLSYTSLSYDGTHYNIDWAYLANDNPQSVSSVVNGCFMGVKCYLVAAPTEALTAQLMMDIMFDLNFYGQIGSITGVYMVDKIFFSNYAGPGIVNAVAYSQSIQVTVPNGPGLIRDAGYTIDNFCLGGYNYTYIEVYNHNGEITRFAYEDFVGNPIFSLSCIITAGFPVLMCVPINYRFGEDVLQDIFVMKQSNPVQCSMTTDNYLIWKAQNQNSIQAGLEAANLTLANAQEAQSKSGGIATMLDSLFDQAGDALGGMLGGLGLSEESMDALSTGAYGSLNAMLSSSAASSLGLQASYVYKQQTKVAEQALRNVQAQMKDMAFTPSSIMGSNSYGDMVAYDQYGFTICVISPNDDIIEHLDRSITALGHIQNTTGRLSRTREKYEYIRMFDPLITQDPDDRPQFVRKMMVDMLADGLYLWWPENNDFDPEGFGSPFEVENSLIG